ncbi:hypothetical protein ACGFT2_06060 [Streptomyces sp. NPDC048514]|uniref:hypothetical protein n=1 Tax=Streptomyces sp. NPDC048514 TaxID=3365564 RepID=UPI003714DC4D
MLKRRIKYLFAAPLIGLGLLMSAATGASATPGWTPCDPNAYLPGGVAHNLAWPWTFHVDVSGPINLVGKTPTFHMQSYSPPFSWNGNLYTLYDHNNRHEEAFSWSEVWIAPAPENRISVQCPRGAEYHVY